MGFMLIFYEVEAALEGSALSKGKRDQCSLLRSGGNCFPFFLFLLVFGFWFLFNVYACMN